MTAVSDIGGTDAPARLTTACATLPGIDLGAMEEQASLMTRVDRK
ncbi:hypothetical protein [Brachybacterium sp. 107]